MGTTIFDTVPKEDYLSLFSEQGTDYQKVVRLLNFDKREVARVSHVSIKSVRYDQKIPREVEERLDEWAAALAAVAKHFKDPQRTVLWFKIPNPLLGGVAPREMLRAGRFKKLHRFILNALNENEPPAK